MADPSRERIHERLARGLYSLAWWLAAPLALGYLFWRARRQPDYRRRIGERFGGHARRADDAPLIWVHAVSVGETRAAQPLVRALLERYPGHRLLLTHMTPTGVDTGRELFGALMQGDAGAPPRIEQVLLPYDIPFAIRRFLRAWRPRAGIVMETELWPNLVAVSRAEGIPLALVNARLSERSLRKGRRTRWLMRPALAGLARVLAQTEADAARIRALGRSEVAVLGNVKFDVAPPPKLEVLGHVWRLGLLRAGHGGAHRPSVLAASTRDGEEALILDAWCAWREREAEAEAEAGVGAEPSEAEAAAEPRIARPADMRWPPLLVIVPRHPQRFDEVASEIERRGLRMVRRSAWGPSAPPQADCEADVVLGDSMGEMFAYYALADVAIVGGSLLPFGGQNLIEACAVGVPVVVGPHTFNFEQAADQAIAENAALRAPDAEAALREALAIAADPVRRQSLGEHALAFAARHRGATARTLEALAPLLR
ncbi:3-deoxy-D-manno-octulosonic acid transferase [Burkholderiaceae bacterium FT117]|uniref:3-deoxy-D-manno-octulosonic acid transferase n=1 Tax=Zeimonas sediminis TaxID=2944268 RepID=UPI002342FCAF|nr:3-deoxy-D-manno-octulosonic acid transferase [Zeimonas sediminis]MCM5572364.1 3-deoxy-D-manno-octulosonic acid transferase [Zeimonas sediminis]